MGDTLLVLLGHKFVFISHNNCICGTHGLLLWRLSCVGVFSLFPLIAETKNANTHILFFGSQLWIQFRVLILR